MRTGTRSGQRIRPSTIGHAVPFVITDTTEPGTTLFLIFAIEVTK